MAMIGMVAIVYWSHCMMTHGWWSAKRWEKKLMKIVWTLTWKLSDKNFTIKVE